MVTLTTTIAKGRINRELTFNGEVFHETMIDMGGYWRLTSPSIQTQVTNRYPCDSNLQKCLHSLKYAIDDCDKAKALAELQAIEDEYAKEKEELPCGK